MIYRNNEDYGFISYNESDPIPEEKLFSNKFPKITSLVICSEFKHFNVDEAQDFNESLYVLQQTLVITE